MMTQETEKVRKQMQIVCIDDLVPQDHLLRIIDKAIDWSFIYDLVRDTYSDGMGRPSIDPVTLIKIPLIQYLYGIKSMRQTIKEIEVNMAYRWFLGLELYDPVPHFSTFGKNYTRRFKDTDLFEQIFQHILEECYRFKLVDPTEIFVDATHVKARANNKKMQRRIAQQEALFYADMLRKDINADRESHGKKPLKDKDDHNKPGSGGHQLALYVIFDSPLSMLCDSPSIYLREEECTRFITSIPTCFEKSFVVDGKVGETVIIARKNGENWYVGGITSWNPIDYSLDLSFLDFVYSSNRL